MLYVGLSVSPTVMSQRQFLSLGLSVSQSVSKTEALLYLHETHPADEVKTGFAGVGVPVLVSLGGLHGVNVVYANDSALSGVWSKVQTHQHHHNHRCQRCVHLDN